ncbi:MAG: histidinol-phosphate transaminase [Oscillospiraceae bacterium]|jgi:histidinol-phosphate aminotransferase|nr:histidinol-phosphate transaminase [Oscillospiraceae bacterium]
MSRFLSNRFASLDAYVPGEQPSEMKLIKLNTNESPYPPSPGVIAAVSEDEICKLKLYPNPDGMRLINKLASHYEVNPENVIIGNGSDELLAFSFLAFFDDGVVFPDITYGFYPVYAGLYNVPFQEIPLLEDLSADINDYININKNIIIANPNAPTGIALELDDIEKMAQSNPNHIIIIDEAYVDFGASSAISLTHKYDNLLIIHTYSKARSMAGARLGFAIGSAPIIEDLNKMKFSFNPYNVNRLTQVMGEAAIDEDLYYKEKQREIVATREYTQMCLQELGFSMTNSKANFLFAKYPDIEGYKLYTELKNRSILVRQWNKPRISDYIRITVGTREQMDVLIAAIKEILNENR